LSGSTGVKPRRRTVPDYEREGRRFYALAAREAEPPWPASVFEVSRKNSRSRAKR
jgi:hypothetical protein